MGVHQTRGREERRPCDRPVIRVAAVVVLDGAGRVLTVRKRGTTHYMQPGGKPEPGESFLDAALRELAEEVGLAVSPGDLAPLGTFHTDAANEAGHGLEGHCFTLRTPVTPEAVAASGEIEELRWFCVGDLVRPLPGVRVAPLLRDHVAPRLLR